MELQPFDKSVKEYSPYTKEQKKFIKERWRLYRDTIGLEGDLVMKLKREGKSDEEIQKQIEEHRLRVASEKESWNNLRREDKQ